MFSKIAISQLTFASHRNRKRTPHSLDYFKDDVIKRYENPSQADQCSDGVNQEGEQSDVDEIRDDDIREI